jgi:hypothetical protein
MKEHWWNLMRQKCELCKKEFDVNTIDDIVFNIKIYTNPANLMVYVDFPICYGCAWELLKDRLDKRSNVYKFLKGKVVCHG